MNSATLSPLIVQLFGIFVPIVRRIIADHKAPAGTDITDEQVLAKFAADIDKYLTEGADWKAAHPKSDDPVK